MSTATLSWLLLAAGGVSLLFSLCLIPLAMRVARRIDFVDHPGEHKSHEKATPYGGGSAIFLAGWLPTIVLLILVAAVPVEWITRIFGEEIVPYVGGARERAGPTLIILAGGVVLHVLGLVDDFRPLGALPKLALIAIVGLLVSAVGGVRIAEFLGPVPSILLTTAWIIVVANAFNFLDNMDGLSAGVACIATVFLIICGVMAGQVFVPGLACVFLGAMLGFLIFNFPPARIFMGDAGSLPVGYMLAVVSILTSYWESGTDRPPFALAMPLVVLAVPLYDFASVVLIRITEGRNPLKGDQRHFSHRLVERGLSRRSAVLTIYLATAATGLGATLLPNAGLRETVTILVMVLMVLLIIAILEAPLRQKP
ncbi:MAG: undecaprenyl/decaprenyl-phosphate alpha-N-acetylglucosaminyl 1-phosphate transferase [Planctomycetes bacterium]|nr:undecaprenyl/decaprenyl-phosphate alpha-N-acetylglucosaminyl 1-phosphate transferase [Planctomycetota bacterium]